MAQCKQSAEEFILDVFSPLVAVLCSNDVESICQKNNLSFAELIQPFCRLCSEAYIRDPNNVNHAVRNLRIVVHDMNSIQPPSTLLSQKLLSDVVSDALPPFSSAADLLPNSIVTVGNHDLQLSATTPWFEAYRETFLQMAYPSDHEFLKHYLACMFVVSSSHPNPIDEFVKLTQQQHTQQHQQPHKLPKWFTPNILRYYVLVHDVHEQDEAKAESIYQSMKTKFGVHACHLLQMNSCTQSASDVGISDQDALPNPWSRFVAKRREVDETSEFDLFMSSDDKGGAFPSHVTEAALSGDQVLIDVETAMEAVEDGQTGNTLSVVDHPLAPSNRSPSLDMLISVASNSSLQDIVNSSSNIVNGCMKATEPLSAEPPEVAPVRAQPAVGSQPSVRLGAKLTLSDHERLRVFLHEFIVHGLIAWAEKTIRTLSEQVMTRRGLHRSFISATKKWFGGGKQMNPAVITNNTNVVYTAEAPEMQMRRLADLAFMFQLYDMAYQIYHAVKKDFNNDHAWLHFAGAMEMACLAVFMQGSANSLHPYPFHYMDTTITTYLAACKVPHFATRATLLSTEVLKSKAMYAEAAAQLIKMTSEESDLRSALLLEQAAHCFIKMKLPMVRKYAFHMILAGHRFNKAWQKRHALRAYAQALQVYKGRGWSLAEDHINFTIGCQAFNLKHMDIATSAFKHLLSINSKQSLSQQTAFLREYLTVFRQLNVQPTTQLPQLPLPLIETNSIKVLCGSLPIEQEPGPRIAAYSNLMDASDGQNSTFARLEELILENIGSANHFKPTIQCFTSRTNNITCPVSVLGEPITVELAIVNPLKVGLVLYDLTLLWQFIPAVDGSVATQHQQLYTNEADYSTGKLVSQPVECPSLCEVQLEGAERKVLHLTLTSHARGELHICSLAFRLGSLLSAVVPSSFSDGNTMLTSPVTIDGFVNLEVQGARLNGTKTEKMGLFYAPDRRLSIVVTDPVPKLEVFFCNFPSRLLCGEVREINIELVNTGTKPLHNVKLLSSDPSFLSLGMQSSVRQSTSKSKECVDNGTVWPDSMYPLLDSGSDNQNNDGVLVKPLNSKQVCHLTAEGVQVDAGQTVKLTAYVRGPDVPGEHSIDFLFYYEPTEKVGQIRHRLVRHTADIVVYPSLAVRAVCSRLANSTPEQKDAGSLPHSIVVALEIENINTIQDCASAEFTVLQVACASREWKLKLLDKTKPADVKIQNRECTMFTLHAVHFPNSLPADNCDDVVFTNVPLAQLELDSARSVAADFYFRSRLKSVFDIDTSSSAKPSEFEQMEKAIAVDLTLIVMWKALLSDSTDVRSFIIGQHNLVVEQLNMPVSCPEVAKPPVELPPVKIITSPSASLVHRPSTELTSQLILVTLRYPSTVAHDFTKTRLCAVNIEIELFNCTDMTLNIDIDTRQSHSRMNSSQQMDHAVTDSVYQNCPSRSYAWAGPTVVRLSLQAGEVHVLQQRACFIDTGIYNLSSIHVSAGSPNDVEMVTQHVLSSSLIIITETEQL